MRAKMSNCRVWKKSIAAISGLIEETNFRFGMDGIKLQAMDPAHISLVELNMPSKMFEEYEVSQERNVGLSLSQLDEFLSRAKVNDEIELQLDEQQNKLLLILRGIVTRRFSIPLIEVGEAEVPDRSKLELPATADVLAGALVESLKDAELVADAVRFELGPEGLRISAAGEKGGTETFMRKEDVQCIQLVEPPPQVASTFAIEYLLNILKAADEDEWVRVRLGNDMPIMLELSIGDTEPKADLIFVLAPRLES